METPKSVTPEPDLPRPVLPVAVKRPPGPGHLLVSLLTGVLLVFTSPHAFAAKSASEAVQFAIKGVGMGTFAKATIPSNPGKGDGQQDKLCVTLEGGSRDNTPALLTWLMSNSAGAALATKPDAVLTVPKTGHGLRKGEYHLTQVTVDDYVKTADPDLSHVRVEAIKVKCDAIQQPS